MSGSFPAFLPTPAYYNAALTGFAINTEGTPVVPGLVDVDQTGPLGEADIRALPIVEHTRSYDAFVRYTKSAAKEGWIGRDPTGVALGEADDDVLTFGYEKESDPKWKVGNSLVPMSRFYTIPPAVDLLMLSEASENNKRLLSVFVNWMSSGLCAIYQKFYGSAGNSWDKPMSGIMTIGIAGGLDLFQLAGRSLADDHPFWKEFSASTRSGIFLQQDVSAITAECERLNPGDEILSQQQECWKRPQFMPSRLWIEPSPDFSQMSIGQQLFVVRGKLTRKVTPIIVQLIELAARSVFRSPAIRLWDGGKTVRPTLAYDPSQFLH